MSFESFPKPEAGEQQPSEAAEMEKESIERPIFRSHREEQEYYSLEKRHERKKAEEYEKQRAVERKTVEEELARLTPEERRKMLADLGLPESSARFSEEILRRREAIALAKEMAERKKKKLL